MKGSRVCQDCGASDGTLYPGGVWCDVCRPFPANPTPDPTLTMAGMRAAAGLSPQLHTPPGPTVVDDRAILSGRRRSNVHDYADARTREESRRGNG